MQIAKFFNVGILQLVIDTIVLYVLVHFFGIKVEYANVMSRAFAAAVGCYLNYLYTFSSNVRSGLVFTYMKFWLFWAGMTVLSSIFIRALSEIFSDVISVHGVAIVLIKLFVESILFVLSFYISKFWVFRRSHG